MEVKVPCCVCGEPLSVDERYANAEVSHWECSFNELWKAVREATPRVSEEYLKRFCK